jgi:oligopeptide transport system substrate-binding protein
VRIAIATATLVVATAVLLAGCSVEPQGSRAIITANGSEPQNPLIPADTVELGGARVVDNIFAGLVAYEADGTAQNDAADSIEPNPERTVFTVKVRSGLKFSDGSEVTAEAFAKAWDWAADSANKTLDQATFSDIKGYVADDPETADLERSSLIEAGGLVIVNEHSFEIHLKSSLADYPLRLGQRAYFPLPAVFYEDPDAFGEHPVGNGPYMLDGVNAWHHGEGIDMIVNPGYNGPRTPVNGGVSLIFYDSLDTAYVDVLAGFLDVLDEIPDSALATRDDELGSRSIDQPADSLVSLTIPWRLPHFTGLESLLRRSAISMAIDRDRINDRLFAGLRVPALDFTVPIVEGYSDQIAGSEVLGYDDNEAKIQWAAADEKKPWEGTFEIAYAAGSGEKADVEAIAASISRVLGIDATAVPYPSAEDFEAAIADHSIATAFVTERTASYPGVYGFLGPVYTSKAPGNVSGYASKPFDAAIKTGSLAATTDALDDSFEDAQAILLTDLPAIPLWNFSERAGYGEKVDAVELDWNAVPRYFQITKNP